MKKVRGFWGALEDQLRKKDTRAEGKSGKEKVEVSGNKILKKVGKLWRGKKRSFSKRFCARHGVRQGKTVIGKKTDTSF